MGISNFVYFYAFNGLKRLALRVLQSKALTTAQNLLVASVAGILYVRMYVYVCVYVRVCSMDVRTYVCMYVRTYVCMYVCTYVFMYASRYVCMYVCM